VSAEGVWPFQWRAPVRLFHELGRLAAKEGTSVNQQITLAVRNHVTAAKGEGKR